MIQIGLLERERVTKAMRDKVKTALKLKRRELMLDPPVYVCGWTDYVWRFEGQPEDEQREIPFLDYENTANIHLRYRTVYLVPRDRLRQNAN